MLTSTDSKSQQVLGFYGTVRNIDALFTMCDILTPKRKQMEVSLYTHVLLNQTKKIYIYKSN